MSGAARATLEESAGFIIEDIGKPLKLFRDQDREL